METNLTDCPVCKSKASCSRDCDSTFYTCPVCGRFELTIGGLRIKNNNHLAPFLFYNHFINESTHIEYRYHTTLSKELCDKYKNEFENGNNTHGHPVHIDDDIVNNWHPKSFSERIDYILLRIHSRAKHIGNRACFNDKEIFSLFFIDRKELQTSYFHSTSDDWQWRDDSECIYETKYMLECLKEKGYIRDCSFLISEPGTELILTPKGYTRIDELQKNTSNGHNALVAMKFGNDTLKLRESIREGIHNAGYHAIFIDEVEHINFITPELLKHIRDSKFIVVDLTHQNNGAYFEEGYAMGLGKPVIQLCKSEVKLHFDIAQKNTIMWETEDDIPLKLTNRIKATID